MVLSTDLFDDNPWWKSKTANEDPKIKEWEESTIKWDPRIRHTFDYSNDIVYFTRTQTGRENHVNQVANPRVFARRNFALEYYVLCI